ncbi:hypothetical protein GALMADRAFT_208439 [Galerina marginata CBS 339.88]|uniref:Uncharacterized protein n=1 Tax=Galerina marginata (strain CBS 339.88) TaxID=685588 RepID=A0A067TMY5_GALM3|nr:hypothetical protein GALMADRAFT_208439 [Galerina marginata CBS 339.88]
MDLHVTRSRRRCRILPSTTTGSATTSEAEELSLPCSILLDGMDVDIGRRGKAIGDGRKLLGCLRVLARRRHAGYWDNVNLSFPLPSWYIYFRIGLMSLRVPDMVNWGGTLGGWWGQWLRLQSMIVTAGCGTRQTQFWLRKEGAGLKGREIEVASKLRDGSELGQGLGRIRRIKKRRRGRMKEEDRSGRNKRFKAAGGSVDSLCLFVNCEGLEALTSIRWTKNKVIVVFCVLDARRLLETMRLEQAVTLAGLKAPKPQSAILSAPPTTFTHRRHPSAPVVVQPTRTPGLLTLSKPLKSTAQRQLPSRREPKTVSRAPKHGSGVVRAQTVTPSVEAQPVMVQAMPSTPSPQPRGRTQAKQAKEKAETYRSASQSSVRGKHGRQPSPPITAQQTAQPQTPSQAEATVVPPIKSTNLFDPFVDHSNSPPPSPLASKPSGKLARRRQQQPQFSTPSKAIPVPNSQRINPSNLSRSDPLPSRMRPVPRRSATYQDFPVCDDMTEVADNDYTLSPPPTPRRPTTNVSGPQTAPLSSRTPGAFPFIQMDLSTPPPSTTKRGNRRHQRVPSEGVFNMSSDEDVSTGPGGLVFNANANVQAILGMNLNKRSSLPSFSTPRPARAASAPQRSRESSPSYDSLSREKQLEREANEKAGYFASSMFQNSPSPEELPDPLFL